MPPRTSLSPRFSLVAPPPVWAERKNTTLAQLGLTARPLAKLSLLANLRYEDKDDTTPLALYNLTGLATNPANFFTNNQNSSTKLTGKLEASYRLPENTQATLGIDYASVQRSRPVSSTVISGLTALREDTGSRLSGRIGARFFPKRCMRPSATSAADAKGRTG